MKTVFKKFFRWASNRSVFSLLLVATCFSTFALSFVLILSLQRIADEHPRRYLSRALFDSFVEYSLVPGNESILIGASALEHMSLEDARASKYAQLSNAALHDKDGIAVVRFNDHYAAGIVRKNIFTVLPQFGQRISTFALVLVGFVFTSIFLVVVAIYFLMRQLTRPFTVLSIGMSRVEDGDLSYQVPLEETFGEFRTFANGFNGMVSELQRIHESRRHMLLALPHELLTPLSRLKVRKELVDDPKLRENIGKDISVVEEILSSILAAERRTAGDIVTEFVDIIPYVNEQISDYVNQGVDITVENNTGVNAAYFDPFTISVILKNFVSNAVRYGNGNPIIVRFGRDEADQSALCVSVQDYGIGIDEEHLKYLTEPFWRADESRGRASGGYGLGLYLCNTIAEGLDCRIEVESKLGEGTTICVVVPNAVCQTIEDVSK